MNIHNIFRPFQRYFRTKRMRQLWQLFDLNSETIILDVGGNEFNWMLYNSPLRVTLLNLAVPRERGVISSGLLRMAGTYLSKMMLLILFITTR